MYIWEETAMFKKIEQNLRKRMERWGIKKLIICKLVLWIIMFITLLILLIIIQDIEETNKIFVALFSLFTFITAAITSTLHWWIDSIIRKIRFKEKKDNIFTE